MIREAKKVLILGYGRAGKRWGNICLTRSYNVSVFDPIVKEYPSGITPFPLGLQPAPRLDLLFSQIDFAIICTPPAQHLDDIAMLFDIGVENILCEKPLCSIGELERAKEVLRNRHIMIAYNYVYHPAIHKIEKSNNFYHLICSQHRSQIPEWGLLLDHCSHNLDIAKSFLGQSARVTYAYDQVSSGLSQWFIGLINNNKQNFFIEESVYLAREVPRTAILKSWNAGDIASSMIELDPNPKMFEDMLDDFLDGTRNSDSALITQQLLEETYAKANLVSQT